MMEDPNSVPLSIALYWNSFMLVWMNDSSLSNSPGSSIFTSCMSCTGWLNFIRWAENFYEEKQFAIMQNHLLRQMPLVKLYLLNLVLLLFLFRINLLRQI